MERNLCRTEELDKYLQKKDSVVIYGGGRYAKRLIDYVFILKEEKKIERMIVTQMDKADCEYRGIKLQESLPFLKENEKSSVLIAASEIYQAEITQIVSEYVCEYHYITEELFFDMGRKLQVQYEGINFIVAGFGKCGTTSLYRALAQVSDIFLSDNKETQVFLWRDKVKNPKKKLKEEFLYNIEEGQVVGMVEPSFANHAEDVYDFFGDKVKLLFLVRNPVEAEFSKFKMDNRNGVAGLEQLYQKNGMFYLGMFDEYFERDNFKEIYEYIKWIERFEKYYPKEQMKIIIFEELIKSPQIVLQDILKFLDVSYKYEQREFPQENKGDYVMADAAGYKLAKLRHDLAYEIFCSESGEEQKMCEQQSRHREVLREYREADKIMNVHMTDTQRKTMENYYADSVRRLEMKINKELSQLWF